MIVENGLGSNQLTRSGSVDVGTVNETGTRQRVNRRDEDSVGFLLPRVLNVRIYSRIDWPGDQPPVGRSSVECEQARLVVVNDIEFHVLSSFTA